MPFGEDREVEALQLFTQRVEGHRSEQRRRRQLLTGLALRDTTSREQQPLAPLGLNCQTSRPTSRVIVQFATADAPLRRGRCARRWT
ncbi:hypothetical protein [Streptomyces coeruleofuscus]|uniref:Uncharacterized protein n=1 Tax=Streptomyces coeruleofuscus TaxID=66879 RepID=A0ABP5WGY5_9ACTN